MKEKGSKGGREAKRGFPQALEAGLLIKFKSNICCGINL